MADELPKVVTSLQILLSRYHELGERLLDIRNQDFGRDAGLKGRLRGRSKGRSKGRIAPHDLILRAAMANPCFPGVLTFQVSWSQCLLVADIVAKVGGGHLGRNNRITANQFLNRHCASGLDPESILLARMRKNLFTPVLRPSGSLLTCPEIGSTPKIDREGGAAQSSSRATSIRPTAERLAFDERKERIPIIPQAVRQDCVTKCVCS
jgi:hypothetical protein